MLLPLYRLVHQKSESDFYIEVSFIKDFTVRATLHAVLLEVGTATM